MKKFTSLLDVRADLSRYYNEADNANLRMDTISYGSKVKIYLRCCKCEKLQSDKDVKSANSYTKLNKSKDGFHKDFECQYCNSLEVKYPKIAFEWDYERNEGSPSDYKKGSRYKAYWICDQGHKWRTSINTRTTNQTSCPECTSSKGEKTIGNTLRKMKVKYLAEYPVSLNGKIRRFDFYLPKYKVYIEVHGKQHFQDAFTRSVEDQKTIDQFKQRYAETNGHYIMVDYREHDPVIAVQRFLIEWKKFKEVV
ncbi:zinc-ribbon domain-containing protein [Rossellomorea marisflavi]|uniref:zinc-ribbon domain-containing protein n=1 Tax=Rossellomorea marisflavi TaxID=189381 RepID=UPI00064EE87D|nr:zinc-ribbon domain-containing protein [Rossellomorea marisflavi]